MSSLLLGQIRPELSDKGKARGPSGRGLKGSHRMEDGSDFSKKTSATLPFIKIYRMSLLSAWSISLDSTFKCYFFINSSPPPPYDIRQWVDRGQAPEELPSRVCHDPTRLQAPPHFHLSFWIQNTLENGKKLTQISLISIFLQFCPSMWAFVQCLPSLVQAILGCSVGDNLFAGAIDTSF